MTGRNEDRVYITYLDIIYSKDNNVRIQACWIAKGKTFSFLIGKVLTGGRVGGGSTVIGTDS